MPMVNEYTIPTINVSRNAFVRNHSWKGTCNVGLLYPIFFDEALPGDTKQLDTAVFGRLNPTVTPVLDNIYADVHYFFVPNRLVWDNWQKFMGERKNPSDSIDYLVPTLTADETNGFAPGGFFDYLSIPPSVPSLKISSALFYARAYNLIWNEWYRSELLQHSVTEVHGDTGDTEAIYNLLPRGKRQDYFTSSFTQPQLGTGASVTINGLAQVQGTGNDPILWRGASFTSVGSAGGNTKGDFVLNSESGSAYPSGQYPMYSIAFDDTLNISGKVGVQPGGVSGMGTKSAYKPSGLIGLTTDGSRSGMVADLSTADANITINSLRQAIAIQQFLERDLMRGTRYIELILSHFGVRCPDYRLQRPEYLGGATTRVNINPVTQTSSTDSTSPQGNLVGQGTVGSSGIGFTHSFTEHGVILGLLSFRVDLNYQQGVDRHFLRNTRYDYFFPTLAHLGMQGIYNKEIYAQGDAVKSDGVIVDDKLFGYNTRYEEYRYKNSYITGKFRSSASGTLDIWHLAENFSNLPVLNDEFITVTDTLPRVMTVQNEPEFLVDCWHEYTDVREVPMYGLPGLERI